MAASTDGEGTYSWPLSALGEYELTAYCDIDRSGEVRVSPTVGDNTGVDITVGR